MFPLFGVMTNLPRPSAWKTRLVRFPIYNLIYRAYETKKEEPIKNVRNAIFPIIRCINFVKEFIFMYIYFKSVSIIVMFPTIYLMQYNLEINKAPIEEIEIEKPIIVLLLVAYR